MQKTATKTTLLLLALLFLGSAEAWGQITLQGRVSDSANDTPLPGANVGILNTLRGTSTDLDGNFSLEVDGFPVTVVVSYIGYHSKTIDVNDAAPLTVQLDLADLELENLVVVGSRFAPRTVITSPVPIDNIKAAELLDTGQFTFDKMLAYSVPSFNSTQQTVSDATAHFDPADLRGLGPSRTLVLINGKRKNPSSLVYINDTPGKGEVGVDMKSIPAEAIERIEVLRDGASAQYGSDAIAGVINVILKDDTDYTDVNLFSGITTEGDGFRVGYSLNTGFKIGNNGFVNLSHTFSDEQETNRAGTPGRDDLFGVGPENSFIQANPDLGMRVGQPNMTRADVMYNAKLPLRGNVEVYSFGGLTYRRGISYALYRVPYWIPDPHNIHHKPGETYNGFHPTFEGDIFDNSIAVGIRGQMKGWDYDISNSFGKNSVDYTVDRSLNTDMGAISPTLFRTGGYGFQHNVINLDVARRIYNATISLGTEFRTENFEAKAGEEASYIGSGTQSFPGIQPQNEVDAIRYNAGAYVDIGLDLTEDFFVGGAARYENYSDFGQNFTWKLNGRFKFMDDRASLRAAASTGFRAPSLHQIFLSNIQTLVSGGSVSNQGTFNNHSPVLRALEVPRLKEENAFNVTAGVALQPIQGLYLSLDVYQVDVDDRIVYSSSIASTDTTNVVGQILKAFDITSLKFFTNAVNTRSTGIDFVANYTFDMGPGSLGVNLVANYNETEIRGQIETPAPIAAANVEIFDRKEQSRILSARPKSKILLGLTYTMGALRAALNNTQFGEVTWQHAGDASKDQTFGAKLVTDLQLSYRISNTFGIGVGVNNLFNVYPDIIDTKGDVLTDLGGRFKYPWEVNQFGFAGTVVSGNINIRF